MNQATQGLFITFEGGEGAGKSTQISMLCDALEAKSCSVIRTLEPGGGTLGPEIRNILLRPEHGKAPHEKLCDEAELLLYTADRAQHIHEIVKPALEHGQIVVSDRHADSTVVYQGMCRGLGKEWTQTVNRFATGGLYPDLTLVLDIPVEIGLSRIRGRAELDRMESAGLEFHRKVRDSFLALATEHKRYTVIDATQSIENMHMLILNQALNAARKKGLIK